MISFANITLAIAALSIIAPKEGEVVPLMNEVQSAYFSGKRAERLLRMDNATDRGKFLQAGAVQKPVKVAWNGATNAVYTLVVQAGDETTFETYALTNRTVVWLTNLRLGCRYSLQLTSDAGEAALAQFTTADVPPRMLRADGVSNFRDLGGWRTTDGKRVRENMILRSAGLRSSSKTEGNFFNRKVVLGMRRVKNAGLATLKQEFKIKTDLELRTPQETAGMETTLLAPNVAWRNISFAAYDFIGNTARGKEPFAKIFQLFLKRENYPILMHCSGGRDRTGSLAFVLNGLLGVAEDDLCRDWEASIFADPGMGFTSERIGRLLDYLKSLSGKTMREKCEAYARSCGILPEEIEEFRQIMLEK